MKRLPISPCLLAVALVALPAAALAETHAEREQSESMEEYSTDAIAGSEKAQIEEEAGQQEEDQQAGAESAEDDEQTAAMSPESDSEQSALAGDQDTASAGDSDEALMDRISRKLTEDEQLQAVLIDVDAEAGTVNLRGQVGSEADRERVMQLVEETEGVQSVQADLQVNETATASLGTEDQPAATLSESDSTVEETAEAPEALESEEAAPEETAEAPEALQSDQAPAEDTAQAPTIIDAEEGEPSDQG